MDRLFFLVHLFLRALSDRLLLGLVGNKFNFILGT